MKQLIAIGGAAAFAFMLGFTSASAATLVSQFTFDTDLSDSQSESSASGPGKVSGGSYNFSENEGLNVLLNSGLSEFSVLFEVKLDQINSNRKLLDVSNLGSDNGLYNYNGDLLYYNTGPGSGTIVEGQNAFVALTFDGSTTSGYLDGALAFSFTSASFSGPGYLSTLTSFTMVEDDTATSKHEASAGSLDFMEVYDGVLSANEIDAYAGPTSSDPGRPEPDPNVIPLPASGLLMVAAIGGVALARRKHLR